MKKRLTRIPAFSLIYLLISLLIACNRPVSHSEERWLPEPIQVEEQSNQPNDTTPKDSAYNLYLPTNNANTANHLIATPTPDTPHPLPALRENPEVYIVQPGDTLGLIALRFSIPVNTLIKVNHIVNPNILEVGKVLTIPAPQPADIGTGYKIIPDSELVASPPSVIFDIYGFIHAQNGYLARYKEKVDEHTMTGTQIVKVVSRDYSVNPRLLLAILEYQSNWVSNINPKTSTLEYPLGWHDPWKEGLFKQLSWAANELNRGYYLWKVNAVSSWLLPDGTIIPINPTINAGTAGVQHLFSLLNNRKRWDKTVGEQGFILTYQKMFGNPFAYTYQPLLPAELSQPSMQLPFEPGILWYFTGGPHGGWGDGSAWAALDFAPPSNYLGCFKSTEWVVAVSDGLIIRARHGIVIQDLDGDGFEQTGWTVLYLHIATEDIVKPGTFLHAGERIGHPSCEGGYSTGTHLHIARRYNGEWIPADQDIPFNLDGWISSSAGNQYDGFLTKGQKIIEAWNGKSENNIIHR